MLGYHSQVILSGRRINDDMGKHVAEKCVKLIIATDKPVKGARVAILGFTFKENCLDTRNTKVIDIVRELEQYGIEPVIYDPIADKQEAKKLYGVEFVSEDKLKELDMCMSGCEGVTYVLHEAAWGSVPRSIEMPLFYQANNITGMINMLEASRQKGVKRFVYAFSSSV